MFDRLPLTYIEPLFRPPSEARSLIFQVTNGCSWNRCTYCEMYTDPQKKFRPRPEAELLAEIRRCAAQGLEPRRVFLADGDALVLSMRRLRNILGEIKSSLPAVTRVSSYCLPSNLKNKSDDDLAELVELGLKLIYVGAESGDDEVLQSVGKGETLASTAAALRRARRAGLRTSVMILNGLGGRAMSQRHALASARLANETQPDYLATLVLTFYRGRERFEAGFANRFEELDTVGLCREMKTFIDALELDSTIFRSDHASNHMVLRGVLGRDKRRLLERIDESILYFGEHPEFESGNSGY
ncbi:MAG: radical SAM protein [Gammaproteobacteria bacterium]|nr:radical SAM protein [Gammaproteobacteria bacterium]MDH3449869.1 radical SAM protein [Gammaproteobacteria bacterium]